MSYTIRARLQIIVSAAIIGALAVLVVLTNTGNKTSGWLQASKMIYPSEITVPGEKGTYKVVDFRDDGSWTTIHLTSTTGRFSEVKGYDIDGGGRGFWEELELCTGVGLKNSPVPEDVRAIQVLSVCEFGPLPKEMRDSEFLKNALLVIRQQAIPSKPATN